MIGTKQKCREEIERLIKPYTRFFLIGCGDCAKVCKTGGEDEVKDFKAFLEGKSKKVTGWVVLEETCDLRLAKKMTREKAEALKKSDCVLVLSCGSGVQTVAEIMKKPVLPVLDSIFAGGIENLSSFKEMCSVCGDCMLDMTAGICVLTRCPKGLVNGPCGGSNNGKCEESDELECAWYVVFERLKERGEIDSLKKLKMIKNYRSSSKPRSIKLQRQQRFFKNK